MDKAYQKALDKIKKAAKTNAITLDLSDMGLTQVPKEIGQLASLQELYLYTNQLTQVPKEIGQLASLETLWLNDN